MDDLISGLSWHDITDYGLTDAQRKEVDDIFNKRIGRGKDYLLSLKNLLYEHTTGYTLKRQNKYFFKKVEQYEKQYLTKSYTFSYIKSNMKVINLKLPDEACIKFRDTVRNKGETMQSILSAFVASYLEYPNQYIIKMEFRNDGTCSISTSGNLSI